MSTRPFEPVADRARWEIVYGLFTGLDIGDIVTYDAIKEALDVPHIEATRSAFYKAANKWGAEHKRAFVSVPTVGYRVASIPEHEQLVRGQHRKSKRAMNRGRTFAHNADRSLMSPQDRDRFDGLERTIERQGDMIRRLDVQQQRDRKAIDESRQQHAVTDERISAVEEALKRHGIEPTTDP